MWHTARTIKDEAFAGTSVLARKTSRPGPGATHTAEAEAVARHGAAYVSQWNEPRPFAMSLGYKQWLGAAKDV